MTVFTEGAHAGEFILTEANGQRSRDNAIVAGGQDLVAGTVVAKPAGDELVAWTATEFTDGVEDEPVGILIDNVDTTDDVAKNAAYIARDAEVNYKLLTYPDGQGEFTKSMLKKLGIIARD